MDGLRVADCSRPHSTTLLLQSLDSAEWRPGYGPKVAGDTDGCNGVTQVVTVFRDFASLCDCFAQIQVLRETFVVSTRRCLAEAEGRCREIIRWRKLNGACHADAAANELHRCSVRSRRSG